MVLNLGHTLQSPEGVFIHMVEEPRLQPSRSESLRLGCGYPRGPSTWGGSQHPLALHSGATSLQSPKSYVDAWTHRGCRGCPLGAPSRDQETDALRAQCLMILSLSGRLWPEWFQEGSLGHSCLMHWLPVVLTPDGGGTTPIKHAAWLGLWFTRHPPLSSCTCGPHMRGSCPSPFRPLGPQHREVWGASLAL